MLYFHAIRPTGNSLSPPWVTMVSDLFLGPHFYCFPSFTRFVNACQVLIRVCLFVCFVYSLSVFLYWYSISRVFYLLFSRTQHHYLLIVLCSCHLWVFYCLWRLLLPFASAFRQIPWAGWCGWDTDARYILWSITNISNCTTECFVYLIAKPGHTL